MYSTRVGFILCNKANSPVSDHHCDDRAEKCDISEAFIVLNPLGGLDDDDDEEAAVEEAAFGVVVELVIPRRMTTAGVMAGAEAIRREDRSRPAGLGRERRGIIAEFEQIVRSVERILVP